MSVYARSQEVMITGDGGVTQGNTVSRCRRREADQKHKSGPCNKHPKVRLCQES